MSTTFWILGSVILVSVASFVGIILLAIQKERLKSLILTLVSFAVGAMFGTVFLHLLPEIVGFSQDISFSFGLVLTGIIGTLILEKLIHWHHCHKIDCEHYKKPVGLLLLVGDGMHNLIDGMLIASAYMVDIDLGIATTIAVMLHELPQEIGDFAVLIHSGYTRGRALLMNFYSALTAVLGAIVVLFLSSHIHNVESILLPLTAGNFLYIAGSDLIPELHRETSLKKTLMQFLAILAGIALMWSFMGGHSHSHENGDGHDHSEEMHVQEVQ